jgi:hypothetical protein
MDNLVQVNDLLIYNELCSPARLVGTRTVTNCFLSQSVINKFVNQKKILYFPTPNGAVFFFENHDLYSFYFHLNFPLQYPAPIEIPIPGKPVVLDLLYKTGSRSDEHRALTENWVSCGFVPYKTYSRFVLELPPGDRSQRFRRDFDREKYELGYARFEEIPAILQLWYIELDPLSVPLPSKDELTDLISKKEIICVRTRDGQIAAVTHPEFRETIAYNWHSVVAPLHRGQGLINVMKSLIYLDHPEITRFYAWMEDNNTRMIEIDRQTGYKPDGLVDYQYILKNCSN